MVIYDIENKQLTNETFIKMNWKQKILSEVILFKISHILPGNVNTKHIGGT